MRIGPKDPSYYIRNLSREPERGLRQRRRRRHVGLTTESKAILTLIALSILVGLIVALALGLRIIPTHVGF